MIGFFLCHKIIIILLFLLVRVFSFLSLYLVNDKIKIVIVASEVAKVPQGKKLKNDVRKNTRQKKIMCNGFFSPISYPFPISYPMGESGGSVANASSKCDSALHLLINLKIISFYIIYYSTILQ